MQGALVMGTRGPKPSVIQRGTQYPVESHKEGHTPTSGRADPPPPPSSSRSGDPPWRDRAPHKKYAVQKMFTIDNIHCPMI